MTTKYFRAGGMLWSLLLLCVAANAQWQSNELTVNFSLPEIAVIDIEPGNNNDIHFTINPAQEPGGAPTVSESTKKNLWINYSSSLAGTKSSRSIVAEISQGTIPSGVTISLSASGPVGTGKGRRGQSAGEIKLSGRPQPIITNIGNCYTGNGINNGHLLSFSINIPDYSRIYATQNSSFLVLYTITDN